MAPTTHNTSTQEVQELDTTPVTSPSGPPTTPRNRSFSSLSSPSSSSTSSYFTAVTTQTQQQPKGPPQALDVTPLATSNFLVAGTDASFMGYTTPTEAESGTAAATTTPQGMGTKGQDTVASASTPQAHDSSTREEEEVDAEDAAKRRKIKMQTGAARSAFLNWVGVKGGQP